LLEMRIIGDMAVARLAGNASSGAIAASLE
jgi:hypothetical protein